MVLAEDKNKDQLKSGLIAVAVLLVLGAIAPTIVEEFTGVNLDDLKCEGEVDDTGTPQDVNCLDGSDKITEMILEGIGYVSLIVALIAFAGLIWVAARY